MTVGMNGYHGIHARDPEPSPKDKIQRSVAPRMTRFAAVEVNGRRAYYVAARQGCLMSMWQKAQTATLQILQRPVGSPRKCA
jgi:hypothetical protein